jgi:hypothetical protein
VPDILDREDTKDFRPSADKLAGSEFKDWLVHIRIEEHRTVSVVDRGNQAVGQEKIRRLNLWMDAVLKPLHEVLEVKRSHDILRRFGLDHPKHLLPDRRHIVRLIVFDFSRALLDRRIVEFEGCIVVSMATNFIILVCLVSKTLQQRSQEVRLDERFSLASKIQ